MTYRTTYDEQSLLLLLHPLDNPTRALRQCTAIGIWPSNTVELEDRRYPGKRTGRLGDAVVDLDVGVLGVDAGVEVIVC